jgi:uncharacterized protein DUF4352
LVGVVGVVAVGAAIVLLGGRAGPGPTQTGPIGPIQRTTTTITPSAPAATPSTPAAPPIINRTSGTPFVLDGARFNVLVGTQLAWTAFAKGLSPGPGNRWVLVTVTVHNISRAGFDPRVLHYRLVGTGGVNYFPNLGYGSGPDLRMPPNPVAIGGTAEAELAFQVPAGTGGLELAFDPTGRHERVLVAIGQ